MKKLLFIFCLGTIILSSCSNNPQAIDSENLIGRYDVDFSPMLSNISEEDSEIDEIESLFSSLFLSQMKMTMQFDEENLIIDATGATMQLFYAFDEEKDPIFPISQKYEIRDDSVLWVQQKNQEFKALGVLRKLGKNYDVLNLVLTDSIGKKELVVLRKQLEIPSDVVE